MTNRDPITATNDLYDLLQVSPSADLEVIEAAYRVLARRYHPDVNQSPDANATMARLNAAWDTLRDPDLRAAYDRDRNDRGLPSAHAGPVGWAAHVAAERVAPSGGPVLTIAPERLSLGPLRQGLRRSFSVAVETEPPGIRVTASVASGQAWLNVSPAVLKGLDKDSVTVAVSTRRLRAGPHRGVVELSTSWETRALPVDVDVTRAPVTYRLASPLGRTLTSPMVLAVLLLAVIVAMLLTLAVR